MIGKIIQGEIEKNWFANIALNSSLSLTLRISKIEDIEFSSENNIYKLIIISGDNETINNLLGLKIGNECVNVTIEGED